MSKETISPVDSYSRQVSKLLLKADRSAERNLINCWELSWSFKGLSWSGLSTTALFVPNWQVSMRICYPERKSFLFAVGHLQLKGRMVLETSLQSQRNNTKWSEICITCFFSCLSFSIWKLSIFSLDPKLQTCYCCIFNSLYILTCYRSVSSWSIHTIIDILRWHAERMLCRQEGTANDKPLGCLVNCNFLCRYVFPSRGEKNRPIVHLKKVNRELRFKGFQELRIHHLAIGINKSYCSLKNTLNI